MTTRKFIMPHSETIGTVGADRNVRLSDAFHKYLAGLEDTSGRVADYVSDTPTATQIRDALVAAGLMKSS